MANIRFTLTVKNQNKLFFYNTSKQSKFYSGIVLKK